MSNRCNDEEIKNAAEFDEILNQKNYNEKDIATKIKASNNNYESSIHFKLSYVNDRCNRKINKLIKLCNFLV